MAPKGKTEKDGRQGKKGGRRAVTLKQVAQHLGLSPATVSLVLNRSPVADSIPEETKERVFAAARELRYRPNYMARSLRSRRSYSVGVLVPEISEPYAAEVMSGIERYLLGEGYFYLVASHRRSKPDLLENYLRLLEDRMVEGLILVASRLEDAPHLPTVVVSGRTPVGGVTHVVVDHDLAAWLALTHLADLGHRRIAFFKGQPESSDTEDRWRAISETAATLGLEVHSELVLQLGDRATGQVFSAEDAYLEGWSYGSRLVEGGAEFTALFAFDDVAAIGAMRAFVEAGLTIPDDVSVVGFDDIQSAAFQNPGLTTVRQPLREMGETAARLLLQSLDREDPPDGDFVTMEPELVVRGSTGPARG